MVLLAQHHPSSALPEKSRSQRLYLYIFRGEPAISRFDWHITSNHKSSHRIVPLTSAGLPPILIGVHPAHG